uniref:Uncharacterized protein n=1 Tax=Arundo donax TaxID=35708 RepID=A0A0A8YRW6_ARUDO
MKQAISKGKKLEALHVSPRCRDRER